MQPRTEACAHSGHAADVKPDRQLVVLVHFPEVLAKTALNEAEERSHLLWPSEGDSLRKMREGWDLDTPRCSISSCSLAMAMDASHGLHWYRLHFTVHLVRLRLRLMVSRWFPSPAIVRRVCQTESVTGTARASEIRSRQYDYKSHLLAALLNVGAAPNLFFVRSCYKLQQCEVSMPKLPITEGTG